MAEMLRRGESSRKHQGAARRHQRLARRVKGCGVYADRIEAPKQSLAQARARTADLLEKEEDANDDFILADKDLDGDVKTTFEQAGQYDREHPGERVQAALFPDGTFTPITRAHRETKEPDLVDQLATRIERLGKEHPLFPNAARLRQLAEASRQAARKWREAQSARKAGEDNEDFYKSDLRRQYEANYHDTRANLGRATAERIFPSLRAQSTVREEEEEDKEKEEAEADVEKDKEEAEADVEKDETRREEEK
ncbi:MAG: hypothetical protein HY720_05220 [Planctomycetes bacterium]|nr:hypothetical protein [Planctomycetota bacterium]